ncbi:hypothetical protein BB934_39655 (plasmid) [Microvirga ossetica]|uniref:Uncharacterized protein n=1 Tax=Microvirga ossetica TaxID=1882682 RepID=A0A1B2EWK5_9HYPH|nr:hypothetical protein BB934_39655 [Microvirga ossetica]
MVKSLHLGYGFSALAELSRQHVFQGVFASFALAPARKHISLHGSALNEESGERALISYFSAIETPDPSGRSSRTRDLGLKPCG